MLYLTALSVFVFIAILYVLLILFILHHWDQNNAEPIDLTSSQKEAVTIIIVARNEANNIGACLQSIINNNYPKIQIILVDDHSEDETVLLASAYAQCEVLSLKDYSEFKEGQSHKKMAIQFAITHARNNLIFLTDADTIVPPSWISSIVKKFENNADFVAAPIVFNSLDNTFDHFQNLDIMGMMGVTSAGIHSKKWYMANGANMAFKKEIFEKIKPYDDNQSFASGDDIFLINAFKNADYNVQFQSSPKAVVLTQTAKNFRTFVSQRIRWATKNKQSRKGFYLFAMAIPFLLSWSIIINIVLCFFFGSSAVLSLIFLLFLKLSIDYSFLNDVSNHFGEMKSLRHFIAASGYSILYIAGIGLASLFIKRYNWKGRLVK